MADVPFSLKLTGDLADRHAFEAYDGFIALAGFARTLTLVTNYVEEGAIRQRGDFIGRHSVLAGPMAEGSLVVDFLVRLTGEPSAKFGIPGLEATDLLNTLVRRVIGRNLGEASPPSDDEVGVLMAKKGGDVEALVAISETPIRQTHSVIGSGATNIQISGGHNIIANFNNSTKEYVNQSVFDNDIQERVVSVAAFNVNSGYGSAFDFDLGRTVPFSMERATLRKVSTVFTWGLDQYSNKTGKNITIKFTRILAMDGTPKRYVIESAVRN
jgi:hypothetical protein